MSREAIDAILDRVESNRGGDLSKLADELVDCFVGKDKATPRDLIDALEGRYTGLSFQIELMRIWMKRQPETYTWFFEKLFGVRPWLWRGEFDDEDFHPLDWFFGTGLPESERRVHWNKLNEMDWVSFSLSGLLSTTETMLSEHPFFQALRSHGSELLPSLWVFPVSGTLLEAIQPIREQTRHFFFLEIIQNGSPPEGWLEIVADGPDETYYEGEHVPFFLSYPLADIAEYLPFLPERWVPKLLCKSLLGFPGLGRIGPIPNLEQRKSLLGEFEKNTSWSASPGLRSVLLDVEVVDWKRVGEELDSCYRPSVSKSFQGLFNELIAYRRLLDGQFEQQFESEDDVFSNLKCLPEAWAVLRNAPPGALRKDLFGELVNEVCLERLNGEHFEALAEWIIDEGWDESVPDERKHAFSLALFKRWKDFRPEDREGVALVLFRQPHEQNKCLLAMLEQAEGELKPYAIRVVQRLISTGFPALCRMSEPFRGWGKILYFVCKYKLIANKHHGRVLAQRFIEFSREWGGDGADIGCILKALWPYALHKEWLKLLDARDYDLRKWLAERLKDSESQEAVAGLAFLHWDEDSDVRGVVLEVLNEELADASPANKILADDGDTPLLQHLVREGERLLNWGQAVGEALLERTVEMRFFASGLGRTLHSRPPEKVEMEINPMPLFEGHRYGESIVKGLILHEIGHHYWDINQTGSRAMRGIAKSRKVKEIFDILIDERLERAMRTVVPEAGPWFDRLAAYAFAQETHDVPLASLAEALQIEDEQVLVHRIRSGELPGRVLEGTDPGKVALSSVDFFNLPFEGFAFIGFLSALRGGMSPELFADQRIGRALACVPSNLRLLPHRDVLKVALAVGEALGVDTTPEGKSPSDSLNELKEEIGGLNDLLQRLLDQLGSFNRQAMDEMVSRELKDTGCTSTSHSGEKRPPPKLPQMQPGRLQRAIPSDMRSPEPKGSPKHQRSLEKMKGGKGFNTGAEADFDCLEKERWLDPDPTKHETLFQQIAPHIRRMRGFLQALVELEREMPASLRGSRIDLAAARLAAVRPQLRLMVGRELSQQAGYYIGILIDNSGSMDGEKSQKAKAFGMLIAEAAKGIRGIEGHINAFDDDTFIRLGDFRSHAIAALDPGGGNNDAGGIAAAADLALASRKAHRILIMIHDDSPTESTAAALGELVQTLTRRHGLVLAQVAVDELQTGAFPHFVDFSEMAFEEAVNAFGGLLRRLMSGR